MDVEHEGGSTFSSQSPPGNDSPAPLLSVARRSSSSEFVEESSPARRDHQGSLFTSLASTQGQYPPVSVPLLKPDETLLPPAAVSGLDSVPASTAAPVDPDSFEQDQSLGSDYQLWAPSFTSFPPATVSSLPAVTRQSSSQTRSAPPLNLLSPETRSRELPFNSAIAPDIAPERLIPSVVPSTATGTPILPYSHGALPELQSSGSPPPFALSSSAASQQQYTVAETLSPASPLRDTTPRTSFAVEVNLKDFRSHPLPLGPSSSRSSARGAPSDAKSGAQISTSLPPGASSRGYEVYIGLFGTDPLLIRYAKWMHAELEFHGVSCFSADRSLYSNNADQRSHDIARGVVHSAAFGVVLISRSSFRNPYTIEELTIFLDRGNLVPVFFDVSPPDCLVRDIVEKQGEIWEVNGGELWKAYRGEEQGWSDAVKGLLTVEDRCVEAHRRNWRESIQRVVGFVGSRLGEKERKKIAAEEEFPWPRNGYFAGREKELKALEKVLFSDSNAALAASGTVAQTLARGSDASSKADAEESEPRLSNYDSESHEEINIASVWPYAAGGILQTSGLAKEPSSNQMEPDRVSRESSSRGNVRDVHCSDRRGVRGRPSRDHKRRDSADRRESGRTRYTHTCVVKGIPGIGKSELALEFAYRHSQKYRRVLWVGGESRYVRQNYLNLSTYLGMDVGAENSNQVGEHESSNVRVRTFDEQESEAVHKVRHELEKDVPYLLIIDNLDAERDSWDGWELPELLPRPGIGATHVIITTRLPRVMHLDQSLEVPYLSSFEALTLMRDGKKSDRSFSVQQLDKFKEFEDKLGRLPFGLAIVGRLINEFNMKPSEILAKMGTIDIDNKRGSSNPSSMERGRPDDVILRSNPFLVKLLDVCFNLMCGAGNGAKSCLAMRMVYVGAWFAPAPCPLSVLAVAARLLKKDLGGLHMRTKLMSSMLSCWMPNKNGRTEADASALLTRLGLARATVRKDCLYFPDIIQIYCQMRGGLLAARSFVRAIRKSGSIVQDYDHFWSAVSLVCRFGSEPAVVEFQVPDLLVFTRRVVMPLALRAFNSFSRCTAAVEVLRLCYVMLEEVEKSYVSQIQDRWDQSLCWRRGRSGRHQVDEYVWQDLTLLKALLLESRAKLLIRGGQFDAGEELCRTCISIRTVMLGADHPDTLSAQETLSKFAKDRTRNYKNSF